MEHRHFFIAGAQRCATTYFYRLLDQHPDITMARPVRPEPKYFIRPEMGSGPDEYRREFFADAATRWLGEKSTSYIEHPSAAERIARWFPDAPVFFLLRDPVERAISNYCFSVANGLETLSLDDALDAEAERVGGAATHTSVSPFAYAGRGHYARQLDAWAARFPRGHMHILTTERLVDGTRAALRDVFDILGIDTGIPLADMEGPVNASAPMQTVPDAVRQRLSTAFSASNLELAARYGVQVGHWQ